MASQEDFNRMMRCCRCRRPYFPEEMTPMVDQYNRWDGVTYRNWCLTCWAARAGAKPIGDPDFYIPLDARTKRMDKLAMRGIAGRRPSQIRSANAPPIVAPEAFTALPDARVRQIQAAEVSINPEFEERRKALLKLPTAEDILGKLQNRSKNEQSSSPAPEPKHTCEFDQQQRTFPCDYCGKTRPED